MNDRKKNTCVELALLAALVWVSPVRLRADTATPQKSTNAVKHTSHATSQHRTHKVAASTSQHPSARHPSKRRVSSKAARAAAERRRRAHLRPEPERIQEIQQALVQAGYLNAQPNGRWDDQTREAMGRYQAEHGFPVTGLPEAKSLMKLGLGPHPLPVELDSSNRANNPAGAGAATDGNAPAAADPQQIPPTRTPPQP